MPASGRGLAAVRSAQAGEGYVPPHEGFRKARHDVEKAIEADPSLGEAHALLGWIRRSYEWDWAGADAAYQRALELEPGDATVVRGTALLAATLVENDRDGSAFHIAEVYAFRGETDEAFEWLERAYAQREAHLAEIKFDLLVRSLQSDPRYAAFLKKMRLPL